MIVDLDGDDPPIWPDWSGFNIAKNVRMSCLSNSAKPVPYIKGTAYLIAADKNNPNAFWDDVNMTLTVKGQEYFARRLIMGFLTGTATAFNSMLNTTYNPVFTFDQTIELIDTVEDGVTELSVNYYAYDKDVAVRFSCTIDEFDEANWVKCFEFATPTEIMKLCNYLEYNTFWVYYYNTVSVMIEIDSNTQNIKFYIKGTNASGIPNQKQVAIMIPLGGLIIGFEE